MKDARGAAVPPVASWGRAGLPSSPFFGLPILAAAALYRARYNHEIVRHFKTRGALLKSGQEHMRGCSDSTALSLGCAAISGTGQVSCRCARLGKRGGEAAILNA